MSKNRIGLYPSFSHLQAHLINKPIFISNQHPVYEGYTNIANALGCHNISFLKFKEYFKLNHKIKLPAVKKYTVIAPFCSDIYPERELLPDHVVKIILDEYDISKNKFIILGGKKDIEKSRTLHNFLIKAGVSVENKVGLTSLDDVINLFNTSQFLLTIDSGLIHLARLVGIKTLSYWGPSDPTTRLDGSLDGDKFYYKRISCSPCVHTLDIAPCNGNNLCMQQYFNPLPKAIFWKIK
jgi:ADP-heptose:LPS heptosyltransferase